MDPPSTLCDLNPPPRESWMRVCPPRCRPPAHPCPYPCPYVTPALGRWGGGAATDVCADEPELARYFREARLSSRLWDRSFQAQSWVDPLVPVTLPQRNM